MNIFAPTQKGRTPLTIMAEAFTQENQRTTYGKTLAGER